MRLALIADIHGNLEALYAVLRDVTAEGADCVICLGDVVGYGPDPGPCLDLVYSRADVLVLGNHDEAAVDPNMDGAFSEPAKESIRITRRLLGLPQRALLTTLPERARVGEVVISHATFGGERWEYMYDCMCAVRSFTGLDSRIGAVGHTHMPCVVTAPYAPVLHPSDINVCRIEGSATVRLPAEARIIVNPGSVGQPRDGNPNASWGLLNLAEGTFEVRRVVYDVDAVNRRIDMLGLPSIFGARLREGA